MNRSDSETKCIATFLDSARSGYLANPTYYQISLWDAMQWVLSYAIVMYVLGIILLIPAWFSKDGGNLYLSLFVWVIIAIIESVVLGTSLVFRSGHKYKTCVLSENGLWIWVLVDFLPLCLAACVIVAGGITACITG